MTNRTNFRVCRNIYLHFICIGARVDSTIYMEVLLVIYFVRYVLLNMWFIHCIMILPCSRSPFVQSSCRRGARVDSTIYMEVLLVIHFVRINGDHLQKDPGVTASFKPTQRTSTPVTLGAIRPVTSWTSDRLHSQLICSSLPFRPAPAHTDNYVIRAEPCVLTCRCFCCVVTW